MPETGRLATRESLPKVSGVLTGNPFVDWGLSIAAAMADLEDVAALTDGHLKNVVGDGTALARRHQRLKAFIPVFGSNTPLHNPKRKGQDPGKAHVANYAALLVRMHEAMGHEANNIACEVGGAPRSLDARQFRDSAGRVPLFGRDWLPLAGSATEANAWPAASRSPHICARCLLAVRLLPSALLLVDGRLTVLQSAPPDFADTFVRDLYDHVQVREGAGEAGRRRFGECLSGRASQWWIPRHASSPGISRSAPVTVAPRSPMRRGLKHLGAAACGMSLVDARGRLY